MKRFLLSLLSVVLVAVYLIISGCDAVPGHELSAEEKTADMLWLYSIFNNNYAPLRYKENLHKFEYAKLKKEYLDKAVATASNEEFFDVAYEFVARFQDAHTSLGLTASNLPGRVKMAYLGFSGKRMGEGVVVTEVLSKNLSGDMLNGFVQFPVQPGDVITHVNGVPIRQYILQNMVRYRNLGDAEANFTWHANGVFNRLSILNGLPTEGSIKLTVERTQPDAQNRKIIDNVTMPWIVKDLYDFKVEHRKSAADSKSAAYSLLLQADSGEEFEISLVDFEGKPISIKSAAESFVRQHAESEHSHGFRILDQFKLPTGIAGWTMAPGDDAQPKTPMDALKQERYVPEGAMAIPGSELFTAYMLPTKDGVKGYIRIPTFSPAALEKDAVAELKNTIKAFQQFGVTDLVVDLMNNGGGSVSLVYQVAQAFSASKLNTHGIEFGLNDRWLDSIHQGSLEGASDLEREIQARLYKKLAAERAAGKRLSSTFSVEELMPYVLMGNRDVQKPFRIVLLTNEMDASAADIFASLVKYNALGVLVGAKTMGAGGNVVQYYQSANAHFDIHQTESLMRNPDGTYIENVGISPNLAVDVSQGVQQKYQPVINQAFAMLGSSDAQKAAYQKALDENEALRKKSIPIEQLASRCEQLAAKP